MGVGGAGMCALAELFARRGVAVSGCDLRAGASVERLKALGVTVAEGHDPEHVADAAAVVHTAAVPADHPELAAARARGLPVVKRARALADVVNGGTVVAVAGTHGKTTTTAMVAGILTEAGLDPTGFVGGSVRAWGGNLRVGRPDLSVVEADEFDRSFLHLEPTVAVVTNLEADHLDTYATLDDLEDAFRAFVDRVPRHGRAVVCHDDPGAARLLPSLGDRAVTYGFAAGAQIRGVDVEVGEGRMRCRVFDHGRAVGAIEVAMPGGHNLANGLAAAAAAVAAGADWDAVRRALAEFGGVGRRFERLGECGGVLVLDDYAHHPTELTATLAAARAAFTDRRLVAVFQPHLYTRTRDFADAFGRALAGADEVWVSDVFPAREAPIPGVTGERVAEAVRAAGADVVYHADVTTLADALAAAARPGDLVLTLGAGSIERVGPALLARLGETAGAVAGRGGDHG